MWKDFWRSSCALDLGPWGQFKVLGSYTCCILHKDITLNGASFICIFIMTVFWQMEDTVLTKFNVFWQFSQQKEIEKNVLYSTRIKAVHYTQLVCLHRFACADPWAPASCSRKSHSCHDMAQHCHPSQPPQQRKAGLQHGCHNIHCGWGPQPQSPPVSQTPRGSHCPKGLGDPHTNMGSQDPMEGTLTESADRQSWLISHPHGYSKSNDSIQPLQNVLCTVALFIGRLGLTLNYTTFHLFSFLPSLPPGPFPGFAHLPLIRLGGTVFWGTGVGVHSGTPG